MLLSRAIALLTGFLCPLRPPTTFRLPPGTVRDFTITIPVAEYMTKIRELSLFKVTAFGQTEGANQTFTEVATVSLIKPRLDLTMSQPQRVGQPVTTGVSLVNPFKDRPLTGCKLIVKDTAASDKQETPVADIPAGGRLDHSISSKAKKAATGMLVVQLDCKELVDIRGHASFNVLV